MMQVLWVQRLIKDKVNKMLIKNALLQNGIFDIKIKDDKIIEIGKFNLKADIDAQGKKVIPGLIDIHIHGFMGIDTADMKLNELSCHLAKQGTTSFLPTTMTDSIENLEKITSQSICVDGANILGFHLEGPYISKSRKGAQNEKYIKAPDCDEFIHFKNVALVTIAPEINGALDFIKSCGCTVSLGHTDCDYETAKKAFDIGATSLTHTFNAMPPLLHRNPGPIGAAIEMNSFAEIICDSRHVSMPCVLALYKIFGDEKLILISDAIRPAGLPDGRYSSGGLEVFMKSKKLTLSDGTLAGGSVPLLECVKTAVSFGIDFYSAVKMASETPAKMLKINKGKIQPGYDADLLILNDDLSVNKTIINGKFFS